jgi:hypothetical protein
MKIIYTSNYRVVETTIHHETHGTIVLKEHYNEHDEVLESYLCDEEGNKLDEYNEIEEGKKLLEEVRKLVLAEHEGA